MFNESFADRTEALIAVTAHELEHINQNQQRRMRTLKRNRRCEPATRRREIMVLRAFREQREELLAEWNRTAEKPKAQPKSRQQKNADKTYAKLAEWEKKLKTAQRKVREYRRKARYYDRALASKNASQ